MARIFAPKENFRLVVEPRTGYVWQPTPKDFEAICETIRAEIKRHVNDVGYIGIEYDMPAICEFCGHSWTEDSTTFNGGCCDKDLEAEPLPSSI